MFRGLDSVEPGPLAAQVVTVTGELEWSPVESGSWRPTVGVGLGYQERKVGGYVLSDVSPLCSPNTVFAFETDPVTGATRFVSANPIAHPACPEFRRDIDISSRGIALSGSFGLRRSRGKRSLGAEVRYSQGIIATRAGHLSTHLVVGFHF